MKVELVVAAIIERGQTILLAERTEGRNPENTGMYESPGGKVEEGEMPEEAIIREVEEELGYKCEVLGSVLWAQINVWSVSGPCCVLFYHCHLLEKVSDGENLNIIWLPTTDEFWENVLPGAANAVAELIRRKRAQ